MNVGGERIAVGIVKEGEVEPAASEMLDQTAVGRMTRMRMSGARLRMAGSALRSSVTNALSFIIK